MCGITGYFTAPNRKLARPVFDQIGRMTQPLSHRGPDDDGTWVEGNVALGHRRLSILDTSSRGRQPMTSPSGRYVITYNGEVYNFQAIRDELVSFGFEFQTSTDTEVIVAATERWGPQGVVARLTGMFAYAIWDKQSRSLFLARDRVGIKPLYYGWFDGQFAFASELHAFRQLTDWMPKISRRALTLYLRYGYVPAPFSIYEKTYKLPQGSWLSLNQESLGRQPDEFSAYPDAHEACCPQRYWRVESTFNQGTWDVFSGTPQEGVEAAEAVLCHAVKQRMISDVPLGAFLSGGIDSAVIVTLMQAMSSEPVKTFTLGVEGHTYDESSDARRLSDILGTAHTEYRVTDSDALSVVESLNDIYDEPFADSSQIPTYLVSRITRKHVTVALSGDGGDEVFGGYNRYVYGPKMMRRFAWLPLRLRKQIGDAVRNGRWDRYESILRLLRPILPAAMNDRWLGITIPKIADLMASSDVDEAYDRLTADSRCDRFLRDFHLGTPLVSFLPGVDGDAGVRSMMCRDLLSYHCDDILVKVDRASMSNSLEVRVPFVDHQVIDFATTLPHQMLIRDGQGKWPLRQILKKRVPDYQVQESKRGFSVPLAQWLRGPLRDWCEGLLDTRRMEDEGFLNADVVASVWHEHLSEKKDWADSLWKVLMFQDFLNHQHRGGEAKLLAVNPSL